MVILSILFESITTILHSLIFLYIMIVIGTIIASWIGADPYNPIVATARKLTQPLYNLIKTYIPATVINGIDFAPLVLLIGLQFIDLFIVGVLEHFAQALK